ncbi:putative amino acid permease YhdG [Pontiella desulfatans]|uniref:Putative amino acid permease YhdG n=1 Tax=Pontiella desulfatans TaxID=2750659 RepID=A0A6C2UDN8_PONDE|nr:amino acid permease [Pontiella desulfatans]VGO17326.1 putative amino acid permease YhdG [Pontiella desulfatans]
MDKSLKKQLGLLDVYAICSGAMISSGLFVLPGIAASKIGPAVIYAYLLSGLLLIPSMLSMAEMSTALPRAGGSYFFVSRSLGGMFGTIDGVGVWLALILKTSIALLGLGAYLAAYVHLPMQLVAIVAGLLFMGFNMVGAKETTRLQVVMVIGLLAILAFLVVRGAPAIEREFYTPMAPEGWEKLLPTAALVFISYIGVTKVASMAEEVKNPSRNLPLGMFISLVSILVLYGAVVAVVVGIVPAEQLYATLTPLSDAADIAIGPTGKTLVSLGAALAFATTANAGIMSASRYLLAMSRDRVIPHGLSRFSRFKTPCRAIALTSAIIILVVAFTGLERIAKLASAFQLLVFAFVNIAVIVMRESGIESYDPGFKSPFYPWVQVVGILVSVVLIPEMGLMPSIFAMGLVAIGVVWHNLYASKHIAPRAGAVAKMAERLGERLLERDADAMGLRTELRQIMKERGLREKDPFVEVVQSAHFIEIEPGIDCEEVIRRGAALLAGQSGISRDLILGALLERNRLGETPAGAGVALPHLLLNDVEGFHMVAARCIHGLDFPGAAQGIHAVFLLLGARSNPTRHLRFLAEIARRAENPHFIDDWISEKSVDGLPELLLAGDRQP